MRILAKSIFLTTERSMGETCRIASRCAMATADSGLLLLKVFNSRRLASSHHLRAGGTRLKHIGVALAVLVLAPSRAWLQAPPSDSFASIAQEVNRKVVKLFGVGGGGIHGYGTGVLISPDGLVLTATSPLLDTADVLIHLSDGRRYPAKVLAAEPALDAVLLKIDKVEDLPFFDIPAAAKRSLAQPGDWVLASGNEFRIATREEPASV